MNNGGDYKIIDNFYILSNQIAKNTDAQVYIDGRAHTIYGTQYDCTKTNILIVGNGAVFKDILFNNIRLDYTKGVKLSLCNFRDCVSGLYQFGASIYTCSCGVLMDYCQFIHCYNINGQHSSIYINYGWINMSGYIFNRYYNHYNLGTNNERGELFCKNTDIVLENCRFVGYHTLFDDGAVCI